MKASYRRLAGIGLLVLSFALAFLVIKYQPRVEHFIRTIGPEISIPSAIALFALVASAPFSVTDALAVMNGAIFGPFWGSIIDTIGLIFAAILGYWIAGHATHGVNIDAMVAKLPPFARRLRIGSPAFLITSRLFPGFGGTLATTTAAAMKVPIWVHTLCMCAVAVPVCVLLTIFGDRLVVFLHGAEHSARMYILHHRPHFHFRHHHVPSPPPTPRAAGPFP